MSHPSSKLYQLAADQLVCVCTISLCFSLNPRWSADQTQTWVNCYALLSEHVTRIIIPLHVMTGSDHTSGFYEHGKKQVLKKMVSDPEARELVGRVGVSVMLLDDVKAENYEGICYLQSLWRECIYYLRADHGEFLSGANRRKKYSSHPTWCHLMTTR